MVISESLLGRKFLPTRSVPFGRRRRVAPHSRRARDRPPPHDKFEEESPLLSYSLLYTRTLSPSDSGSNLVEERNGHHFGTPIAFSARAGNGISDTPRCSVDGWRTDDA